jgi:hypothetical protein
VQLPVVHVWQPPPQALLQQTPLTQKPLVQALGTVQATPFPTLATHVCEPRLQ